MKILFLLSSLEAGGAERVAAILCSAWAAKGHDVVLMPTFSPATAEGVFPADARVLIEPLGQLAGPEAGWLRKTAALRKELKSGRYDVVCSFLTNVNITALVAGLGLGMPVIVSERTFPPAYVIGRPMTLARRIMYPLADYVVMQTREGLDWLRKAIPRARGTALVNPLNVPVPNRAPVRPVDRFIAPDRKLILAVGRLVPEKRFDRLIEQFAALARDHPDWDLIVLGEGPEREALQNTCARAEVGTRVMLAGDAGNLDEWYRRADAFAMVSRFEGFPNALAEAVGYAVPALAIDCPTGPSQLVSNGRNGVLLPRDASDEHLRQGLERLITTQYPGKTALAQSIRKSLDSDFVAGRWLKLFEAAITKRRQK